MSEGVPTPLKVSTHSGAADRREDDREAEIGRLHQPGVLGDLAVGRNLIGALEPKERGELPDLAEGNLPGLQHLRQRDQGIDVPGYLDEFAFGSDIPRVDGDERICCSIGTRWSRRSGKWPASLPFPHPDRQCGVARESMNQVVLPGCEPMSKVGERNKRTQ